MKEVMEFLQTSKVFYLATTSGDQPHVRPMGFVMEWEGKLAFCTSNQKEMYKQLVANPKVEFSCIDAGYSTLRLSGKAVFCTAEASQRKALEAMPTLSNRYAVGDGKFEIFYLDNAKAVVMTMTGEKRVLPA